MRKHYTAELLTVYNEFQNRSNSDTIKESFNKVLTGWGFQLKLNYEGHGPALMYNNKVIKVIGYEVPSLFAEYHTEVNNYFNNLHKNEVFMLRGDFARDFEQYILSLTEWEDYMKLDFYERSAYILTFAKSKSLEFEEVNETTSMTDTWTFGNYEYSEEGLTIDQRIKLLQEFVKDLNEEYNRRSSKRKDIPTSYIDRRLKEIYEENVNKLKEFFDKNEALVDEETGEVIITEKSSPKEDYLKSIQYTLSRVYDTIEAKNSDYTADNADPLTNFLKSENFDVDPINAVLIRIQDKMSRISGLVSGHQAKVVDEKVEDTIVDSIGYFANMGALIDRLIIDSSTREQALILTVGAIEDLLNLRDQLEK